MSFWKKVKSGVSNSINAGTSAGEQLLRGEIDTAANTALSDPYLSAFAGALTANATTAYTLGAGMSGPTASLQGLNASGFSGPTDATAKGALAGYGGTQATQMLQPVPSAAETPPDLADMYANDPNTSAQFSRLRKSARMLGRAGTFKNKGSASALGLGEQILGDQMSLIGA